MSSNKVTDKGRRNYDFGLAERIVAFLNSRNGKPANRRTIMRAVGAKGEQSLACSLNRLVRRKKIERVGHGLYNRKHHEDETQ